MIKRLRINNQIRISPVRVIDEAGQQLGVMPLEKALQTAQEANLDLVEIVEKANPPICKIINYGKYLYQQEKKARHQKIKQKKSEIKGVRLGLMTAKHDLELKAKLAQKFLEQGHKVKLEIILKGRQKARQDLAREKLNEFVALIPIATQAEQTAKKQPRGLNLIISLASK